MKKNRDDIFGGVAIVLLLLQTLAVLLSWLVTAAMPDIALRSLISSEGTRWLFGQFVDNMAQPALVWLLLATMAVGAVQHSRIGDVFRRKRAGRQPQPSASTIDMPAALDMTWRQRAALRLVIAEVILMAIVLLLLTVTPHAVLLSVTGQLWPSSFSRAVIPLLCLGTCLLSVSYGVAAGTLPTLAAVFRALTFGVAEYRWVWPLYILAAELWFMVKFIFMI